MPDTKIMTLPRDAHWVGEWVVRERGIDYVNQHSTAAGTGIELLPFRPAARARPIRILPLAAPPSGSAPSRSHRANRGWRGPRRTIAPATS